MGENRNLKILLIAGLIVVLAAALSSTVPVVAKWKTRFSDETGNLSINVSGETSLLDEKGKTVEVLMIAKLSSVQLSFYYNSIKVSGMVVKLNWEVFGQDVDWSTLNLLITATGTGGYSDQRKVTLTRGTAAFTLPISTSQLGRTPSSGETVTWELTIVVEGNVKDKLGNLLTAKSNPIRSTVSTVWYEPSFGIKTSASTETAGETASGGCGGPGEHVIWVYGVEGG